MKERVGKEKEERERERERERELRAVVLISCGLPQGTCNKYAFTVLG